MIQKTPNHTASISIIGWYYKIAQGILFHCSQPREYAGFMTSYESADCPMNAKGLTTISGNYCLRWQIIIVICNNNEVIITTF